VFIAFVSAIHIQFKITCLIEFFDIESK